MDTYFDYSEMIGKLEGLLLDIYRWYLEIDKISQMRFDYAILIEEGHHLDELAQLYELPHSEFFTCDLEFKNAISNNLCIGDI